jgi:tetratricopeptide (TPR) repeat protein
VIPSREDSGVESRVRAHRWGAAALLLLAVAITYSGSLNGPFVYDDVPAILQNPTLRNPWDLAGLLAPPGDQAGTVGGRPVLNLSFALNFAAGGTRPLGYHIANVGIHAAATLLLFGIILRALSRDDRKKESAGPGALVSPSSGLLVAFISALLWTVHPLQTESVTYVVQRAEALTALFYLLTLYAFVRYAGQGEGKKRGWAAICVTACLLGMATKETMASAPLATLLYDRAFVSGTFRDAWRRHRAVYVGLGATWLLLIILVAGTHGRGGTAGFGTAAGVWPYALTQCKAIAGYTALSFWPRPLIFDYGTSLVHVPTEVIGSFLLLAFLLVGTAVALRRNSGVGFAAFCFFALLAPSSSFVPVATEPIAEHRMYLALAVICLLSVATVNAALSRVTRRFAAAVLFVLGIAAATFLGAATVRRNRDYRSEVALWTDTVAKMPANPRAHNNLAEALLAAGQPDAAAAEFAAAVQVDPGYSAAHYNLGVTLLDSGHPQEAIPHLEEALSAPRHQAELRLFLGEALERVGRHADAADRFREAFTLAPSSSEAAFGLGNNLAALGRYGDAAVALRSAADLAPGFVNIRNNLANALWLAGRRDEAIAQYREALKLEPGNASIRENLRLALEAAGK